MTRHVHVHLHQASSPASSQDVVKAKVPSTVPPRPPSTIVPRTPLVKHRAPSARKAVVKAMKPAGVIKGQAGTLSPGAKSPTTKVTQ